MNVEELRRAVEERGEGRNFSIQSRPDLRAGLPNAVTIVQPSPNRPGHWDVFFTERGRVIDPHTFDSEELACDYAYGLLTAPTVVGPRPTDEEIERSGRLAREREARLRAKIPTTDLDRFTGPSIDRS
jgi:hypothetical protein